MGAMSNHKTISLIKSGLRILGYALGVTAFFHNDLAAGAFLILIWSEILGIMEEAGEK
jgi:hypothetical protein